MSRWTYGSSDAPAIEAEESRALLPDIVDDGEIIILFLKPSVLSIVLASLTSILVLLIVTLTLALCASQFAGAVWTEQQAYVFGVLAIVARLIWQTLDWGNRVYILTDRRIITRWGVLRMRTYEAKLRSIRQVTVFQRVRERVFFLGSVGFATDGSGVFDTFWLMVRNPFGVHRTIVETISRYGGRPME